MASVYPYTASSTGLDAVLPGWFEAETAATTLLRLADPVWRDSLPAYLDGRGSTEMRLNFSGVSDADIREGVRRIGKVVREQLDLYSSLTGVKPAAPAPENVVELRRRAG